MSSPAQKQAKRERKARKALKAEGIPDRQVTQGGVDDPNAPHLAEKLQLKALRDGYKSKLGELFADPRWQDLFGDDKFTLIDVGSQGGLEKEWLPVTPLLRVVAVEPRTQSARVSSGFEHATFEVIALPLALDAVSGMRQLHWLGSLSSFLPPDLDRLELYGLCKFDSSTLIPVETTTLDVIADEQRLRFVDFIKLDTQGTELDILRGGPVTVGQVAFGLCIEVSFVPLYESQPLFGDVDAHVRSQGFEFLDLIHFRRYPKTRTGAVPEDALQGTIGQLVLADALYLRPPTQTVRHLRTLNPADRVRYMAGALVTCLAYSRLDTAAHLIHEAASLIDARSATIMVQLLGAHVAASESCP